MASRTPSALPANRRYLEVEQEERRQLEDYKRQRLLQLQQAKEAGQSGCEECLEVFCCAGSSGGCGECCKKPLSRRQSQAAISSLSHNGHSSEQGEEDSGHPVSCSSALYALFPCLAIADLVLGTLAKATGLYSRCLVEVVCHWSSTACALWIATLLAGIGVFVHAAASKIYNFFRHRAPPLPPLPPPRPLGASLFAISRPS